MPRDNQRKCVCGELVSVTTHHLLVRGRLLIVVTCVVLLWRYIVCVTWRIIPLDFFTAQDPGPLMLISDAERRMHEEDMYGDMTGMMMTSLVSSSPASHNMHQDDGKKKLRDMVKFMAASQTD
ncbi:hypothetical protein JTE90_000649 [Oedothorax gibbosus]|uniref:Uncharacterized protein n=1 Tax=Oedothorax gibbosus TaxID=931172 RepID=A0AAV6VWI2_9ARAC|nr:hypothetical protein JTE90_000649 [Oedothorax gibbosus]